MYNKIIGQINVALSIGLGVVNHYLGGWDLLLNTFIVLVILDFVTGWLNAIFTKRLSSEIGSKGVARKIVIFIIIAVANLLQELLNDTIPLREIILMFYIVNEALSIIENAAYFVPIPEKLKQVILQLNQNREEEK